MSSASSRPLAWALVVHWVFVSASCAEDWLASNSPVRKARYLATHHRQENVGDPFVDDYCPEILGKDRPVESGGEAGNERFGDAGIEAFGQATPDVLDPATGAGFAAAPVSASPFVIGDSPGFGSCGTLVIDGVEAVIGHPNFGCNRINLAENGSPFPVDRVFVSYRHFENPTTTNIFGHSAVLDVDRVTVGLERTMFCGLASLEVRLPFNSQLSPIVEIEDTTAAGGAGNFTGIPVDSESFELGNLALAMKAMLFDCGTWGVSAGVGLGLPTARSVTIDADLFTDQMIGGDPATIDARITSLVSNETVYLTPFLAGSWNDPNNLLFAQAFAQFDFPLNSTRANLGVDDRAGSTLDTAQSDELTWQSLFRLNVQGGVWIYDNPCGGSCIHRLAALAELHWTSTLNDADTVIADLGTINSTPIRLNLGNMANRVDVLNLIVGASLQVGPTDINVGYVIPLSGGANRAFDHEVNVIATHRF